VRSLAVDYLPFLKYKGVVNIIKTDVEIELDKIIYMFFDDLDNAIKGLFSGKFVGIKSIL